jgi:hypothetical protein
MSDAISIHNDVVVLSLQQPRKRNRVLEAIPDQLKHCKVNE